MKLKILFPILFFAMAMMLACKKEPAIQTDTVSPEYKLPQGNHPYDTRIVNFYNKYGTYILYKFSSKDFRWNITTNLPYTADQADEAYVGDALDMLDQKLFNFYPEVFLKKTLPYKILLCSRIRKFNNVLETDTIPTLVNAVSSFSHLAFGHASSHLTQLSADELDSLKADLHTEFWSSAIRTSKIELPSLFITATDYSMVFDYNKGNYGVFEYSQGMNATDDFLNYIGEIITHTADELEQTVFTPNNDPNGRFRYKYNVIVNYYKSKYNFDLQAIGNSK